MRFIDTRIHGYLDYLMGLLLMAAPWLFGFAIGGAAQWLPFFLGVGVIIYSILTDYELGLLKVIPMKAHLVIDLMGGILLAASPWIFGFADEVFLPHLLLGIAEIGASLATKQHPPYPTTSVKEGYFERDRKETF